MSAGSVTPEAQGHLPESLNKIVQKAAGFGEACGDSFWQANYCGTNVVAGQGSATVVDEEFLRQGFVDAPDNADGRVNKGESCRKLIKYDHFRDTLKHHVERTAPCETSSILQQRNTTTMGQAIQAMNPTVKEVFDRRWVYGHSAAYMVEPEFMKHKHWRENDN